MKLRRSTVQWIITIVVSVVVFGGGFGAAYYYMTKQYKQKYEEEIGVMETTISEHKRMVYVAVADLQAGEQLSEDKVQLAEVLSFQPQNGYIDAADFGTTLRVDVPAGNAIEKTMVTSYLEGEESYREVQYGVFPVPYNISEYDYCDLRIAYPNGETYIVLAKKQIFNRQENGQDCCMYMTPEEIDRMQSCIVDSYLYDAEIFLTKYIEPNIQTASVISYTPSLQSIDLIKKDPNIVTIASAFLDHKVRMELENRLTDYTGTAEVPRNNKELQQGISVEDESAEREPYYDDRYFMNDNEE